MKKMLICCATLCVTLALFCVCALADDLKVTVNPVNAETAQVVQKQDAADLTFTVTKNGVKSGELYLVLIQKGNSASEAPLPDKDNIYYLDVEDAKSATFTKDVCPRDEMKQTAGTYVVYLSDWSESGNGAAKGVATITLSAPTPDTGDSTTPGGSGDSTTPGGKAQKLGDVNDDTYIDGSDAYCVMRIFAGLKNGDKDWTPEELAAAHVNDDEYVDGSDALLIMQHFAGLLDDDFKRK